MISFSCSGSKFLIEITNRRSFDSSTSVGENLTVKIYSQFGLTDPLCGDTVKNPESILPVSELTILQA